MACSICQDRFKKSYGETLSTHFLKYAIMGSNLSPRLSDIDLINAISGHSEPYIQRTLLSANIKTVQEALDILA